MCLRLLKNPSLANFEPRLGRQPMARAHESDAFIAKQRAELDVRARLLWIVNDGKFSLAAIEQRQRIDDEARNDVEFDFGPERPIGIHGGHEPPRY